MRLLVTLCALILCGCKGASDDQKTSGEASPGGSGTTVYSMEVANRCAGFGAAQAAELLAVPAAEIEPQFARLIDSSNRGA